ncbi:MAG: outer membrane beta-barrel protein [candidate division Zixibacteria bacterium]|nr:outer membrane beta-barrel protein [candidate division Zixibacteria bacterium]
MKKIALTAAILLALASAASAQIGSPIKLYAAGGLTVPNAPADFKTNYNTGYHGMFGVSLSALPILETIGKVELHKFGSDIGDVTGGDIQITMYGVDGKLAVGIPGFPLKPYAFVGIGLAQVKQPDRFELPPGVDAVVESLTENLAVDDQTKFYYNIGVGVEYPLIRLVKLFAHARVINIGTSQAFEAGSGVEPIFDDSMGFWGVTVGIKVL